jgi:hypothetical protein
MGKPLTIEYSYIYIFLGLIIIISIIYIYILFNRLPSINSNIDFLNNDLNNLKVELKGLNAFKDDLTKLDLNNTLQKLSTPPSVLSIAGADGDVSLKPSDVVKMIGLGKYGFIQQHLDLQGNFGYSNVLTIVPNDSVKGTYISQIWLSTIYSNDTTNGDLKKFYIRYSNGTVNDILKNPPVNDKWNTWVPIG